MEVFSTSTATLLPGSAVTILPTATHREALLLRTAHASPYPHLYHNSSSFLPHHSYRPLRPPSPLASGAGPLRTVSPHPIIPATTTYTQASTGYAAALLDVARCTGAFDQVERDACRLLPLLWQAVEGTCAEEAVLRVIKEGAAHRHIVVLVRMLIRRGKVGLVGEVMEELGRLCDELRGTKVVLVTSEGRMAAEELAGIAEKVRRRSGAATVKVRHVVCESSSF